MISVFFFFSFPFQIPIHYFAPFPAIHLISSESLRWNLPLLPTRVKVCLWLTFIVKCDLEVAVYEGVIREKPTSKEEARQFLKDYSGKLAATVGSVLVTNLKTGLRKGDLDRVDVLFSPTFAILKKREHYGAEELHSFGFVGGLSVRIPTHPADVH
ncbi:hypothetical protein GmHk_14G040341 [Glycine max]|nr:hypothetical protein GmHk_14G040341 [Glycine max]